MGQFIPQCCERALSHYFVAEKCIILHDAASSTTTPIEIEHPCPLGLGVVDTEKGSSLEQDFKIQT